MRDFIYVFYWLSINWELQFILIENLQPMGWRLCILIQLLWDSLSTSFHYIARGINKLPSSKTICKSSIDGDLQKSTEANVNWPSRSYFCIPLQMLKNYFPINSKQFIYIHGELMRPLLIFHSVPLLPDHNLESISNSITVY